MSEEIRKCPSCETGLAEFEIGARDGPGNVCRCTGCGKRFNLYFLPGSKKRAFVMEVLAEHPPAKASEAQEAPAKAGGESKGEAPAQGAARDARQEDNMRDEAKDAAAGEAVEPDPVDVAVGRKIRQFRKLQGLSQQKLAKLVGITFQQVQKYERGANRVVSSRLMRLAHALEVPVWRFFEDLEQPAESGLEIGDRDIEVVRAYRGLSEDEQQRMLALMKAVSTASGTASEEDRGEARQAAE